MADNNKLIEQMLEHLVNDDSQKAEELFHEYVVAKSREIYEGLIEAEMKDDDEDDVEEAKKEDDEEKVEEDFDDLATEADDEMDLDTEDPTDSLAGELGDDDMGDEEMTGKSEEELFQDLDDIVDELQARFDAMEGGDDMDDMGDDEEMKDDFELETVREYVEKVPAGHGAEKKGAAEKADSTKSTIDNMKNDMGGTTANLRGGEAKEASKGTAGGLANNKPQDMKTGNINVPGGNAGKTSFKKKEPGHGAEKKGAAEGSTDGQSLFRGRR
jgi:hypothetical protein